MQDIQQLAGLDPLQRTQKLNAYIEQYIHKNGLGEKYESLSEVDKQDFIEKARGRVAEKAPDIFKVEVEPEKQLKIRSKSGNILEGSLAQRYMETALPKSGRARAKERRNIEVIEEAAPAKYRPLFDPSTENLIQSIKNGEVNVSDFEKDEVEQLIPLVRLVAPEKSHHYINAVRDDLSKDGIEPGSFALKSAIRGAAPFNLEQAADKIFERFDNFDGTTNKQYERWRKVYGDIDEDFRNIGAVAGLIGLGGGSTNLIGQVVKPGKVQFLSKLLAAGVIDSGYTDQLPGISAEMLGVENEAARKALTFGEGMLLAGLFDMGTAVAKRLKGKTLDEGRKILAENGAHDIDGKLSAEARKIAESVNREELVRQQADKVIPDIENLTPSSDVHKKYQRARVVLQDPYKPIHDLQRKPGMKVQPGGYDPYTSKRLAMPETMQMQKAVREEFSGVMNKILDWESRKSLQQGTGYKLVNDYLESLHAPERNAFMKKQAKGELSELYKNRADLEKSANYAEQAGDLKQAKSIRKRLAGINGQITKYKNTHDIALNDNAAGMTTQQANELRKNIEGRADFNNIKSIADDVQRIHKRTLDFLFEGELISEKTYKDLRSRWKNHVPLNRVMDDVDDDGIIQIMSGSGPGASVQSSGLKRAKGSDKEVLPIIDNVYSNLYGAIQRSQKNLANLSAYDFYQNNKSKLGDLFEVKPAGKIKGNNDLIFYKEGKKMAMTINDPELSKAFQYTPKSEQDSVIRLLMSATRYLGAMYTKYSVDFFAPNKIRDMVEAAANTVKTAGIKGAAKSIVRAPVDMAAVASHSLGLNNKAAQRYQRLIDAGGSTGSYAHMFHGSIESNFEQLMKNKTSSWKNMAKNLDNFIDKSQMIFEDSTRLSVFESALDAGKSPREAALAARDSSFDPLLRGESGNLMSGLFLFWNPAVQSATNIARSMMNPKTMATVSGTLFGAQYALDRHNRSVNPDYRSELSSFERSKNFVYIMPTADGSVKKITFPVSYGLLPIKATFDYVLELIHGDKTDDFVEAVAHIGKSVLEGYNPLGGTDMASSLTPTVAQPFNDIRANKDNFGGDLRPEFLDNKNVREKVKVYDYTATTKGGQMAIAFAAFLDKNGVEVNPENMLYMYKTITGGPGKTVLNLMDVASSVYNGEAINPNSIPIFRRFYSVTPEELANYRREKNDDIEKIEEDYLTRKTEIQQSLRISVRNLVNPEKPEDKIRAAQTIKEIVSQHPYEKDYVERRFKEELMNLSSDDKRIRRFGVEDMGRAKLYLTLVNQMDPVAAEEFLQDQKEKGLLNKDVFNQMRYIKNLTQQPKSP